MKKSAEMQNYNAVALNKLLSMFHDSGFLQFDWVNGIVTEKEGKRFRIKYMHS